MNDQEHEIIEHRLVDPDEEYFLDLFLKSYERAVNRTNDALNRLVTLGTAMTGGALVLLKEDVCYGWWRVTAASLFFLALGTAIYGSVPAAIEMQFSGESVKTAFQKAAANKKRWIWTSSTFLRATS